MSATASVAALLGAAGLGFWGSELARRAPLLSISSALGQGVLEEEAAGAAQAEPEESGCGGCDCLEPEVPAPRAWLRRLVSQPGYGPEVALGGSFVCLVLCRLAALAARRRVFGRPRRRYASQRVPADRARPAILG